MPTTTIRIEDELKARVAAAAERTGQTAHAFIVDAIARTVEQHEVDEELHRLADKRWAKLIASGQGVAWDEAKRHLSKRLHDIAAAQPQPAARKPRRAKSV